MICQQDMPINLKTMKGLYLDYLDSIKSGIFLWGLGFEGGGGRESYWKEGFPQTPINIHLLKVLTKKGHFSNVKYKLYHCPYIKLWTATLNNNIFVYIKFWRLHWQHFLKFHKFGGFLLLLFLGFFFNILLKLFYKITWYKKII